MTADAQNEVTIWSATLTPQRHAFGPTVTAYGYFQGVTGSLSDTDFVYRGTTYTISRLETIQYQATWETVLDMTPALPECDQAIGRFYSNNTNYTGSGRDPLVHLSSSPRPPWDNGANASVSITVAPVAPDAPTNLVQIVDGTLVTLIWDTSCDGGSDVTRHEYRLKEVGEASFDPWRSIPSSAPTEANDNSYTLPSFIPFIFEVRAVNAKGEGPSSDPSRTDSLGTVCTRTAQVRDAIVAATSRMSCGYVTVGDLAAITQFGLGSLRNRGISSLTEGDFDGLSALTTLILNRNGLTSLPTGVFEPLTSLTTLNLQGNPGAPFAPTADALPDDGTVSNAGGTVTLDGSGSGGAWGTNVTYGWALTDPASGVMVTFDDAASATPVVTIPALTAGTKLTFTLTVTGRGGTSGTAPDTDTAKVTVFDRERGICQRTEAVRDELVNVIGVTTCSDVTDAHLADITGTLNLGNKGITALAAGDFDGLTALTQLQLFGNSLSTLPDSVFDGLTALTTLKLNDNSLTTLPAGVFDELTALTTLWLEKNFLTSLPADVFDELTALTVLYLHENSLTSLPAGVFDELTALTVLWLHNNSLTTLPANVFAGLTALGGLYLGGNDLTTLPAGVFDGLTALVELSLNENELTTLDADVFNDQTALLALYLFDNALSTLPAGVFDGLTALTELYLFGNSLSTLPDSVFDGLTALRFLILNNNSLGTLPAGVFDELTALGRLELQDNPGAPFSPTAVALPDDGEVPSPGGTATLDGSGSGGGPWGTNLTYSWALTSPTSGVTVTFDDNTSATPVVTVPALAAGTELTFTLTVTGRATNTSYGTAAATDAAIVTAVASTAGICGRTQQVRDELLDLIEDNEGATVFCADVTDAHLAAIPDTLSLAGKGITALAAGDFAGLSGVTLLNLLSNDLTYASRRGVRRTDRADGAVSAGQLSDHASRRRVRRTDRADGAESVPKLSGHAPRRGVQRPDRTGGSGS